MTLYGGRGYSPLAGTVNLLSQKITKSKISYKQISTSYSHAKTPNLQKFFDSESMTPGEGGVPPLAGTVNLQSQKITKSKIS